MYYSRSLGGRQALNNNITGVQNTFKSVLRGVPWGRREHHLLVEWIPGHCVWTREKNLEDGGDELEV